MKTIIKNIKMKHILTATLLVLGALGAQASLLKQQTEAVSKKGKPSEEVLAARSDSAIDFQEWENDFNDSIKDIKQKECKGKNCKFKDMQALDPSFEF